ncbi:hypothetical protein H6G36_20015 [Anabaena minutissima FACHB-250]|nr:hypothetical protein [Anabaena minutissima FACHB-250]
MNNQHTKTHSQQQIVNKLSQFQPLNLEQLTQVNGGFGDGSVRFVRNSITR